MIGNLNQVYEILSHKRALTLPMIRRLHQELHIPAQSLIGETVRQWKEAIRSEQDCLCGLFYCGFAPFLIY